MDFLNLDGKYTGYQRSRIVILPVPYGGQSSQAAEISRGPRAILEASSRLETYDMDAGCEIYPLGIHTLAPLTEAKAADTVVPEVKNAARALFKAGKLPVALGGRQLITLGMVEAALEKYPELTVVHLDARLDMLDPVAPRIADDESVLKRVSSRCQVVHLGTRCVSRLEHKSIDKTMLVTCRDLMLHGMTPATELLDLVGDTVYLSIDLDVLDPSIMPAVPNPEPGGLDWFLLSSLIRRIVNEKTVVGLDVVELLPDEAGHCSYFAAKLVHQTLSLILRNSV